MQLRSPIPLFFILLLTQTLFSAPTFANSEVNPRLFTYCSVEWAPWIIIEDDQFSGRDIELIHRIAKRLNIKVEFLSLPWSRCLAMLRNGRVDMTSSLKVTDDRLKFLEFIKPAHSKANKFALYTRRDNQLTINSLQELKQHSVGVVTGYYYFPELDTGDGIDKIYTRDDATLIRMLARNRFDVVIADEITIDYQIEKAGLKSVIQKHPSFVKRTYDLHLVLSKASPIMKYQHKMSQALKTILEQQDTQKATLNNQK